MTATPTGQMYWLSGAFISAVLVLLVAVPLVISYQTTSTLIALNEQADPADELASEIQTALSHEFSAIIGFQASGEEKYTGFYQQQTQIITAAVAQLDRLAPTLGPAVQTAVKEIRIAVDQWHEHVRENRLLEAQLPEVQFRQVLFDNENIYEQAQQATGKLNEAVTTWRSQQRARVQNLTQLTTTLSIVFAFLAVPAVILVVDILRRLGVTSAYLESRAKEEEALRQVAHSLTGALTLDDVLNRITETAALAGDAEAVYIETINLKENEITCVASYGSGVPPIGAKSAYEGSIVQQVVASREPQIVPDLEVHRERKSLFGELARRSEKCAAMLVPLVANDEVLGALLLVRRHPKNFTPAEFPRVRILADVASVAMQRAFTLERLSQFRAEEHFIAEAAPILASSLDYQATLNAVVRLAVPQIADWSAVYLVENGKIQLAQAAHSDPAKMALVRRLQENYLPLPEHDTAVVRVIRTGKPELFSEVSDELLRQNTHDEAHLEVLRRLNVRSSMVVPLSAGGETFGALSLVSEQPGRYRHEDLGFAEDIARHAALAIQNARLYASADHAIRVRDDAIRARDEILRVVSHDLRNPVHNIQMTAKVLAARSVPEEKRRSMVQIISRAAERMNRLIDDLLAVARVREGEKISIDLQPLNPFDIIREACEIFSIQARMKSIDLHCKPPGVVPTVLADSHRILQVLSNLLDNAIKFTPEGGRITVTCEPYEGGRVRFAVRDTGRGIEQENLGKIFDLFWQAKSTAHMGAGLGLGIARAVVEQHGGQIWAESQPGAGTTFFFTLPQATRKQEPLNRELAS
ncbi:MAG TPA: ATP-binding protein [Terriglobia bacterium]|nr:ATP-binding protein [Terriglobia bacterium]